MNIIQKDGKVFSVVETEINVEALQQQKADLEATKKQRIQDITDNYDAQIAKIDEILNQADTLNNV